VVKLLSPPYLVPAVLVPTMRKWYLVFAAKPLMFALTFWYEFPVLLWFAVVCP
jgi:hypothetical protein